MNKLRMLLAWCGLTTLALGADFVGQGYFKAMASADPTLKYVKIQGDSGFYCILDDKSSFRFKIIGDSITTPLNGMDRITYAFGSGSLRISGEEKGEPYSTTFAPSSASQYPTACVEEEEKLYGQSSVGVTVSATGKALTGAGRDFDALGRKQDPTPRSAKAWRLRRAGHLADLSGR